MQGTESGNNQPGGVPRPEQGDGRPVDEMASPGKPSDGAGVVLPDVPERQWHADVQSQPTQPSHEPYAGTPVQPEQVDVTGQPVSHVQGGQWHDDPQAYAGQPSHPSPASAPGQQAPQPGGGWHDNGAQQHSPAGPAAQQAPHGGVPYSQGPTPAHSPMPPQAQPQSYGAEQPGAQSFPGGPSNYGGAPQGSGQGQPGMGHPEMQGRPGEQGPAGSRGQAAPGAQSASVGQPGSDGQQSVYAQSSQQGQPLAETQRVPRGGFVVPDAQYTDPSASAGPQYAGAYGDSQGGQGYDEVPRAGRRGLMTPLNIALGIAVLVALGMTIGFIALFAAKNSSDGNNAASASSSSGNGKSASGETSSVGEAVAPSEGDTIKVPSDAKECKRFTGGAFDAVGTLNASTSCEFAVNVHAAYVEAGLSGDGTVTAFSPATKKDYEMSCSGSAPVTCTGGVAAKVILYKGTLNKQ